MTKNHWVASIVKTAVAFSALGLSLSFSFTARAQQPDPSPIPPPAQPAPASPNAPTEPVPSTAQPSGTSPSSHLMRTWRRLNYTCEGDVKVVVNLHAKEARVVYKNHTYNMKQEEESDGQKYTDGSLVWRNKGEEGSLERASKSGSNAKALATGCHLQSAGTNPPAASPKNPPSQR